MFVVFFLKKDFDGFTCSCETVDQFQVPGTKNRTVLMYCTYQSITNVPYLSVYPLVYYKMLMSDPPIWGHSWAHMSKVLLTSNALSLTYVWQYLPNRKLTRAFITINSGYILRIHSISVIKKLLSSVLVYWYHIKLITLLQSSSLPLP